MRKRKKRNKIRGIVCVGLCLFVLGAGVFAAERYLTPDVSFVQDREKESDWKLILVNRWNQIPDDYKVELTELKNGQSVDSRIYPDLQDMMNAAREEGIYPIVASGYRTTEKQKSLLDEKIREFKSQGMSETEAEKHAEKWVAVPGTSEHQLGMAVDINADTMRSVSDDVYEWLYENGYKYGFILRYPEDKIKITGTDYEPWHYRYVGKKTAAEIYEKDICLEEYLGTKK